MKPDNWIEALVPTIEALPFALLSGVMVGILTGNVAAGVLSAAGLVFLVYVLALVILVKNL